MILIGLLIDEALYDFDICLFNSVNWIGLSVKPGIFSWLRLVNVYDVAQLLPSSRHLKLRLCIKTANFSLAYPLNNPETEIGGFDDHRKLI
jgi:hypothetical protein